jgi:hypothetical protein
MASKYHMYNTAVEAMMIGYKPGIADHTWFGRETRPQDKVNYILADTISGSKKVQRSDSKKPLNPCQKPSILAETLCRRHCSKGQWAIVLCAGQGGEVVGCLNAGLNVMAVEIDEEQLTGLHATLLAMEIGSDEEILARHAESLRLAEEKKREKEQRKALKAEKALRRQMMKKKVLQQSVSSKDSQSSETTSRPDIPVAPPPEIVAISTPAVSVPPAAPASADLAASTPPGVLAEPAEPVDIMGYQSMSDEEITSVPADTTTSSSSSVAVPENPDVGPAVPASAVPDVAAPESAPRRSSRQNSKEAQQMPVQDPPVASQKKKQNKIPRKTR